MEDANGRGSLMKDTFHHEGTKFPKGRELALVLSVMIG
jgi:hypothetical protein